jgi:S-methylmethionine-dependent homocysteine/selenocysteine methylase
MRYSRGSSSHSRPAWLATGTPCAGRAAGDAIAQVDRASASYPSYYGINCAHPDHFGPALAEGGATLDAAVSTTATWSGSRPPARRCSERRT